MVWALHDGIRGAIWTIVKSDGKVIERKLTGPARLGEVVPATDLGTASPAALQELAATLVQQGFDRLKRPAGAMASPMAPQVELSLHLGDENYSFQLPSFQLDQVPELQVIHAAFQRLKSQLHA